VAKNDIPTVSTQLYALLKPMKPEERSRAVKAAYAMLGEIAPIAEGQSRPSEHHSNIDGELPARAKAWMKSNGVTDEQLSQMFHIADGKAEITASKALGKSAKEQTINTFVLTGISKLLEAGEAKFDDATARANCKALGCFDAGNHAKYMKQKGNLIGGSKSSWTLTAPGMKAGAELVKKSGSE
jgi:hypothetical protein